VRPSFIPQFRGLALRIGLLVLAATFLATLFVSGVSVHAIRTFLTVEIEQKFSAVLWSTAERLDLYYDQRLLDVEVFARSRLVSQNTAALGSGSARARSAAREEVRSYLGYVLEGFPQYRTLLVLDRAGGEVLTVGEEVVVDEAVRAELAAVTSTGVGELRQLGSSRFQVVSVPLQERRGEPLASLHAVLRFDDLLPTLQQTLRDGSTTLSLTDRFGKPLGAPSAAALVALPDPAPSGSRPIVTRTLTEEGAEVIAASVRSRRFGWTIAVQEPYETAFAPVAVAVRRVAGFNLVAVVCFSLAAFLLVAWRLRTVHELVAAARQISGGQTLVEIPEGAGTGEIGTLTRAFNEMSSRLHQSRRELEDHNQELRRANEVLEQLSITDGLTRLHNHRAFQDQYHREAKRADRTGQPLSLILIDIDDFKLLNDRCGHAAGDAVLQQVATVMNEELRDIDFLARYGGEEFALIAPQTDLSGAEALGQKLRRAVAEAAFSGPASSEELSATVSIGVAEYDGDAEATFHAADAALYEAKAAGKDCVIRA